MLDGGDVLSDGLEHASELGGGSQVLSRRVTLACLAVAAREHNKVVQVLLEAVDVGLESLNRAVDTAVVDSNADAACLTAVDASGLELGVGETTAGADLDVVLGSLATDDRAQKAGGRARADSLRAGDACETAALLGTCRSHPWQTNTPKQTQNKNVGEILDVRLQSDGTMQRTGLIEERLHATLPLLVEVLVRHDIVVAHHLHNRTGNR